METNLKINEPNKERDYFPSLFANKNNTILILAEERTSEKTFAGMIIHSSGDNKKASLGTYSTGWTYTQFKRLSKGSKITLEITQEN